MHIVDELRGQLEAALSVLGNWEYGRTAVARGDAFLTSEQLENGIVTAAATVAALEVRIAQEIAIATSSVSSTH